MKTLTVDVYEFDELSETAKEKARDWYRTSLAGDTFWSDCTIEEIEQQAALLGIEITNRWDGFGTRIYWSGFGSQGDGACFEGEWRARDVKAGEVADGWGDSPQTTEIRRIAKVFADVAAKYPFAYFRVDHAGHYYHEHGTEFTFDIVSDQDGDNQDAPEKEIDAVEATLKKATEDFARYIYKALELDYEYNNSDEAVDENIIANEYGFTKEGDRRTTL